MKNPPHKGWYCKDCGKNTFNSDTDYYMLTEELWQKFGVENGMLCIICIEHRIGRKLKPEDLIDCLVNTGWNPYTQKILKS